MLVNAEFERRVIGDRTQFGIHQAKKSGRYLGRAPFGYSNARDGENKPIIVVNEKQAPAVRQIFADFVAGLSVAEISARARKIGFVQRGNSAIQRVLSYVEYAGFIEYAGYADKSGGTVRGIHEPIISETTWHLAQDRLRGGRKLVKAMESDELPLRGAVCCGECGGLLTGGPSKGRHGGLFWYYRCLRCKGQNVAAKHAHEMMGRVLEGLKLSEKDAAILHQKAMASFEKKMSARVKMLEKAKLESADLDAKIDALESKFLADQIGSEMFQKWGERFGRELAFKRAEIERLAESDSDVRAKFDSALPKLAQIDRVFDQISGIDKRRFLRCIFGENLALTKSGYRTPFLVEVFTHNSLKINELAVLEGQKKGVSHGETPVSSRNGTIIEPVGLMPLVELLYKLAA